MEDVKSLSQSFSQLESGESHTHSLSHIHTHTQQMSLILYFYLCSQEGVQFHGVQLLSVYLGAGEISHSSLLSQ